ncbi:MAG TPA: hypothetical protein VG838_10050 [Opitutaceae bacterium]|nr:hypothetical protein [Opitutaceae bacterium]
MSAIVNLPADLVAYLRSEAYATLCRTSLIAALDEIEKQKQEVMATKPPFGMLAPKSAREAFQTSLRSVLDTEEGLQRRIAELAPIDGWLEPLIPRVLHKYLMTASADYQYYNGICDSVKLWEYQVNELREKGTALARDARAVGDAIANRPGTGRGPRPNRTESLATLRATVVSSSTALADIAQTASRVTQLSADELPATARLPAGPQFRNVAWIDRLITLADSAALAELEACEDEARAFTRDGVKTLLEQAATTHAACLQLREDYLQACWQEARDHALRHYVKERDLDEVIAELHAHHVADVQQRQAELIHNSFEFAGGR